MRRKEIRVIRAGKEVIGEGEKKKEEIKKIGGRCGEKEEQIVGREREGELFLPL